MHVHVRTCIPVFTLHASNNYKFESSLSPSLPPSLFLSTMYYVYVTMQCWSPDGYHLWMLPVNARTKAIAEAEGSQGHTTPVRKAGGHPLGNKEQILVMRFLKNAIINNPIIVSCH